MHSVTTTRFRECFGKLPAHVQQLSRKAYRLWKDNLQPPSIQFKLVVPEESIYSVRVSLAYRALGVKQNETIIWFWIGSHTDYEKNAETVSTKHKTPLQRSSTDSKGRGLCVLIMGVQYCSSLFGKFLLFTSSTYCFTAA